MSFNIVDLVKDQIGDQVMSGIGNALGMQGSQASTAMSGAIPGLLGGLMNSANTSSGAGALFDAVQKQDDSILGNMGNLLGGDQASSIANQGTSVLSSLLGGGAVGKLAGVVANMAGISSGNSSSLLGMLAPIVLSVIKKKVLGGGMNASSLANMLSDQNENINAAMPQGFADKLQSEGFFDSIGGASSSTASVGTAHDTTHSAPTVAKASGGGGLMKWIIPLVAIAVLAWLAMQFFGGSKTEDAVNATGDAVSETASQAAGVSEEALQAARDALPEGVELDSITDGLNGVFGSTQDALSGITDVDSATAAIPSIEEAAGSLSGINDVVARLPDAAKGPIGSIVSTGLSGLQPLIEKVTAIPGVGDILQPVIGPMVEMLQGLAG